MKYHLWGVMFLISVITVACSQVAQPTSGFSPVPTIQTILPTPTPPMCIPTTVTVVVTPTPMPLKEATPRIPCDKTRVYELVSGDCRKEECLFRTEAESEGDYPVGVATIKGYYRRVEQTGLGDIKKVCDSFVIVSGSQELIRSILALIDAGNGVYSKNELNQPVISLDLNVLAKSETSKLVASTPKEPVELVVLAHAPSHMGAPICFTRFEILKVNSIAK
jgi:hypothetical protein